MSLATYRQKRNFRNTPEPSGAKKETARGQEPRFVIQKHDATRLHYDFRLEADGVLKSWAVPKGPSLDPGQKRLAVEVEDHPLDYGGFEGVIPAGQYGAGPVLLWDQGTWSLEKARSFDAAYRAGKIEFELSGEKLQGHWVLVRTHGAAAKKPQWLLIKRSDSFARHDGSEIVDELAKSVSSGRTIEEVDRGVPSAAATNGAKAKKKGRSPEGKKSHATARLKSIHPQLATLSDTPPDGFDWLHEIKFDGYRMLSACEDQKVRMLSRNGLDWTHRFPVLVSALAMLPVRDAVLDGEVVMLDERGISHFQALQEALSRKRTDGAVYFVFDLLELDGQDLTGEPLESRKQRLADLLSTWNKPDPHIRLSEHILGGGPAFYEEACRLGLEGIISKRRVGVHRSGRSHDWLKIKGILQEPFAIAGYTRPAGSRTALGALLLGRVNDEGKLVYCGKVGTGFDEAMLANLKKKLDRLKTDKPPFAEKPPAGVKRGATWVRPELICQVGFAGWTRDQVLRQARFLGLRGDRTLRDLAQDEPENRTMPNSTTLPSETRLTHPERVLYPKAGVTKLDLAKFYTQIADWVLPHLAGRPLSIVRCPSGLTGPRFFQKHAGAGVPAQIRRLPIEGEEEPYMVIDDLAGLLVLVQISALELHVWGSRDDRPERPDRLVFDLDPGEGVPWSEVIATAIEIRDRLTALDLVSFVKTTGGKGLHVVVPIARTIDWTGAKEFTRSIAQAMVEETPDRFVMKVSKAARTGKILIDYLRNGEGATSVAAYSTRARENATVSVPLTWDELESQKSADAFTVKNLPARLESLRADPWKEMAGVKQSITKGLLREVSKKGSPKRKSRSR